MADDEGTVTVAADAANPLGIASTATPGPDPSPEADDLEQAIAEVDSRAVASVTLSFVGLTTLSFGVGLGFGLAAALAVLGAILLGIGLQLGRD